jgi:hypothetical protein
MRPVKIENEISEEQLDIECDQNFKETGYRYRKARRQGIAIGKIIGMELFKRRMKE